MRGQCTVLPVHWRFRVLKDDYPSGEGLTAEAVWDWCLQVHQAVCELAGGSEPCETMDYVRRRMAFSVDIQPKRRLRERELFGELRTITRVALNGAALLEQEDNMAVRVVDLHPWVAEPAEPLFDGGHYRQAVLVAAQNIEVQWRGLLGVSEGTLSILANKSFSEQPPDPDSPRLRYPAFALDSKSDAWKNAHVGVMEYAKGCARRIRNLGIHHPEDREPDSGVALETLSALSLLARWITDAEVQTTSSLSRMSGPEPSPKTAYHRDLH